MRLDNVFYGFTKNGERKLLWKRYKTEWTSMGDVVKSVFYDLEEKVDKKINTSIKHELLISIFFDNIFIFVFWVQ